eukprot:2386-Heterococcus_DN1.PRE.7
MVLLMLALLPVIAECAAVTSIACCGVILTSVDAAPCAILCDCSATASTVIPPITAEVPASVKNAASRFRFRSDALSGACCSSVVLLATGLLLLVATLHAPPQDCV